MPKMLTSATIPKSERYVNFGGHSHRSASDWFKNNPLLSELTHAHYREPVPLKRLEQLIWWSSQKHVLPPRGALRIDTTVV